MNKHQLTGLSMRHESHSYVDAMHAILTHRGSVNLPKATLAGMTVNAFRFTVSRKLGAASWHAYNWMAEHFLAADFIGITSSQMAGFSFDPTFPVYQKHAISAIKRSIDDGTGAVFWKDDFVVAAGYDDEAGILLYADGADTRDDELKRLPYEQFGRNDEPYWYFQTLESQVPLDEREIYRESFMQAIYKWETHDPMLPARDYACGQAVYPAFIDALQSTDCDEAGAAALIRRYAAAKSDLAAYTAHLACIWPACAVIAADYEQLAALLGQLVLEARTGSAARLVPLLRQACTLETHAIQGMKSMLRETLHNRFHDIGLR
ncbi:hypothetical protein [Paenibacillus sp. R14(2021)]|uniref:hypothetical protein n=1 Tax=Paenibacillus sp. R14(2021) TaxID=2859228 RepID=UPI001C612974|nr:hypothetical protein [Paenibacillus sp. R14(2021)]